MKYLHITINNYDESFFPLKKMNYNLSFKIEYNNNFIRIQINKIIDEIFKGINNVSINAFKGSGEGTFLELKVDEIIRSNSLKTLGIQDLECRYLFSLVSSTPSSNKTILEHRKREVKLMFFGKNGYNILIDDIDKDTLIKNNQNHYNLDKNYYYFSQVSLTGKAFDMCIIEREKDNTFKLYLFQVSKNKYQELQEKYYYSYQANCVAKNLKNLYKIDCTNKYLIFILPKISDTTEFRKNLELKNYYYIFYDSSTAKFYNKNENELHNLEFQDSLINLKEMTEIKDSEKIKQNYFLWENSMKSFLNKKRTLKKTFYQIYINNYYNFNKYKQVKLNLANNFKDLLFNEIKLQKDAILKFIGNCKLKNINTFKNLYKMVIIFKKDGKIYVEYNKLYLLKNNNNNYSFQSLDGKEIETKNSSLGLMEPKLPNISSKTKKYNIIQLSDLFKKNKYNGECFCYLVITGNNVKEFYNYWC